MFKLASTCFQRFSAQQLRVRLGEWNLDTEIEVVPYQEFKVERIVIHPQYHNVYQHYDVALLLLDRPAVLGATVNTICFPPSHLDYAGDECVVSGWGTKDFDDKSNFQKVSSYLFKLWR